MVYYVKLQVNTKYNYKTAKYKRTLHKQGITTLDYAQENNPVESEHRSKAHT